MFEEPEVHGQPLPERVGRYLTREAPEPKIYLARQPGARVTPRGTLDGLIQSTIQKINTAPSGGDASVNTSLQYRTYSARSNLAGQLRRFMDGAVVGRVSDISKLPDVARRDPSSDSLLGGLNELRKRGASETLNALEAWTRTAPTPTTDLGAVTQSLQNLDQLLEDLPKLVNAGAAGVDNTALTTLLEGIRSIRLEVAREAKERLVDDTIVPGDRMEPLTDHLTGPTTTERINAAERGATLWQACSSAASDAKAFGADMRKQAVERVPQALTTLIGAAADSMQNWENELVSIVHAADNSESGDKVDASRLLSLSDAMARSLKSLHEFKLPSMPNYSARDFQDLDRYVRCTASTLADILTVLPLRDWISTPDIDNQLGQRSTALRLVDSPPDDSIEKQFKDKPTDLAGIWNKVSANALSSLSSDSNKAQEFKKNFRNWSSKDLSSRLKSFAKSPAGNEADAWAIGAILSDCRAQIDVMDRLKPPDELELAHLREALTAIGDIVALQVAQKHTR